MKRFLLFIIMVSMVLTMTGCGDQTQEESDRKMESSPVSQSEQVTEILTEAPTDNPDLTVSRTEKYTLTSRDADNLPSKIFYEDIAWANLRRESSNDEITAVINTNGECLYIADDRFPENAELETTPFINGLSAVYPRHSNDVVDYGFIIVNTQGQEVYSSFDENTYFCGQADNGLFFIIKHDYNYDHDNWYFCTLDKDLTLKETPVQTTQQTTFERANISYITDDMYYFDTDDILNFNTDSFFSCWDPNRNIVHYAGHNNQYAFINNSYLPLELFKTADSSEKIIQELLTDSSVVHYDETSLPEEKRTYSKITMKPWHDGSIFREYTGDNTSQVYDYVDLSGNQILVYPDYIDSQNTNLIEDFSGDYSAVYFEGVDNNYYVCLIDETGQVQYEPIQIKGLSLGYQQCSCNGYVFLHTGKEGIYDIIAPDGSHIKLGDNFTGLKDQSIVYFDNGFTLVVGNGYIFCNAINYDYSYAAIDGSKTITSVTASYNSKGELIYTDHSGNKTSVSGNTDTI